MKTKNTHWEWNYMVDWLLERHHSILLNIPLNNYDQQVTEVFCTYVEKHTPMLVKGKYRHQPTTHSS